MDGYYDEAKKVLKDLLKNCNAKNPLELVKLNLLDIPVSYKTEYDTAIQMLEWDTSDEVELTRQEFTQYVMDSWIWKSSFLNTTSNYTSKTK
jgi:hypothetical protein